MSIRITIGRVDGREQQVELTSLPDSCPHCHYAGQQVPLSGERVHLKRPHSLEHVLYIPMKCPRHECGKPFFAMYEEPRFEHSHFAGHAYKLVALTPWTPIKYHRQSAVSSISPSFYEIFDQAAAAEAYRLPLVAGAGYRKALEYLVKDYAAADARKRLQEARAREDEPAVSAVTAEIEGMLEKPLGDKHGVIAQIPDEKLQKVAERAAWLGNDEVHYTRKWTDKDINDLKTILGLVENIIVSDANYRDLLEDMPDSITPE